MTGNFVSRRVLGVTRIIVETWWGGRKYQKKIIPRMKVWAQTNTMSCSALTVHCVSTRSVHARVALQTAIMRRYNEIVYTQPILQLHAFVCSHTSLYQFIYFYYFLSLHQF